MKHQSGEKKNVEKTKKEINAIIYFLFLQFYEFKTKIISKKKNENKATKPE